MLDVLFNDQFTVRRLSGLRDGHGKPTYKVIVEQDTNGDDTDVPIYVECYLDRRRSMQRTKEEGTKLVDATLYYNVGEARVKILDQDLIVMDSTGETYRASTIHEQVSAVEGSEYGLLGLTRVKTPVLPNSTPAEEV